MRRTRSLKKMKLPFNNPSTSRSPSGYAAVITLPSSFTRAAMVSAANTMRLSSRPPVCLSCAVLGNIEPHRPGSGRRDAVGTTTDARDPQNGFTAGDDGIAGPLAARHARFHQEPSQRPVSDAAERQQLVALLRPAQLPARPIHPGAPGAAVDPSRRGLGTPLDAELAEQGAAPLTRREHALRRALHHA